MHNLSVSLLDTKLHNCNHAEGNDYKEQYEQFELIANIVGVALVLTNLHIHWTLNSGFGLPNCQFWKSKKVKTISCWVQEEKIQNWNSFPALIVKKFSDQREEWNLTNSDARIMKIMNAKKIWLWKVIQKEYKTLHCSYLHKSYHEFHLNLDFCARCEKNVPHNLFAAHLEAVHFNDKDILALMDETVSK